MKTVVVNWDELCCFIKTAKKENKRVYVKGIYGTKKDESIKDVQSITLWTDD